MRGAHRPDASCPATLRGARAHRTGPNGRWMAPIRSARIVTPECHYAAQSGRSDAGADREHDHVRHERFRSAQDPVDSARELARSAAGCRARPAHRGGGARTPRRDGIAEHRRALPPHQEPLRPTSECDFEMDDLSGMPITFDRGPDGAVSSLRMRTKGGDMAATRVDQATAEQVRPRLAQRIENQTPTRHLPRPHHAATRRSGHGCAVRGEGRAVVHRAVATRSCAAGPCRKASQATGAPNRLATGSPLPTTPHTMKAADAMTVAAVTMLLDDTPGLNR